MRHDGFFNRWFLDPVFRGHYPADMLELYGELVPQVEALDMQLISAPIDFLGVNYYNRAVIRAQEGGLLGYTHVRVPGEYTAMDWEVHPDSLRGLLLRLQRDYGPRKLFITENGAAYDDVLADGEVNDAARLAYMKGHIGAVREAAAAGVNVAGYFVWSLLDNFEWAHGYGKRFGIVHVDFETQARTPKRSALWYRDWLKDGA